mmetsp:Transcript_7683/g.19803  ORF Transcript_7683/g.19803 Transcript_7683/m.19803 type:complete len:230 (+) Transcript_7683:49-738(+)
MRLYSGVRCVGSRRSTADGAVCFEHCLPAVVADALLAVAALLVLKGLVHLVEGDDDRAVQVQEVRVEKKVHDNAWLLPGDGPLGSVVDALDVTPFPVFGIGQDQPLLYAFEHFLLLENGDAEIAATLEPLKVKHQLVAMDHDVANGGRQLDHPAPTGAVTVHGSHPRAKLVLGIRKEATHPQSAERDLRVRWLRQLDPRALRRSQVCQPRLKLVNVPLLARGVNSLQLT